MTKQYEITEVTLYPIRPTEKGLIAFASCTFSDALSLNSIAIYTRPDGRDFRLVYPQKLLPNGKQISLFYPINRETGELIKYAILNKYSEINKNFLEG